MLSLRRWSTLTDRSKGRSVGRIQRSGRGDHTDRGEDLLEEADDSVPNLVAHDVFFNVGTAEGMIAESVHALPTCTGDYIVFGPEFQSEFTLEVNVEVLILLSVGWLGAAHFD